MTDLTTLDGGMQLPAHLQRAVAAMADHQSLATTEFGAGINAGALLPTLSIRGKEFRLRWQGTEQPLQTRHIDVILVAARPNVSKRWYASRFTPGAVEAPDCSSVDAVRPDVGAKAPQSDKCGPCPHNQFGSKITETGRQGKACSDYKRVVALLFVEGRLMEMPVVLDLPASSMKKMKDEKNSPLLFLREYMALMARHKLEPHMVVTRLTFTDSEYPRLAFSMHRYTEEAEFTQALALRESDEVQDSLTVPEAQPEQAAEPALPAGMGAPPAHVTAPQPQAAPAPQPEPVQAPVPNTPPPPPPVQQEQPQPAPQPAPAEAPAPAADSSDPMEEVRQLLGGLA